MCCFGSAKLRTTAAVAAPGKPLDVLVREEPEVLGKGQSEVFCSLHPFILRKQNPCKWGAENLPGTVAKGALLLAILTGGTSSRCNPREPILSYDPMRVI